MTQFSYLTEMVSSYCHAKQVNVESCRKLLFTEDFKQTLCKVF